MKRFRILFYSFIASMSFAFSQSGQIIDDIYVTPNDAKMIKEINAAKQAKKMADISSSSTIRNGARELVFIDKNGNRITEIPDTLYVVENTDGDTLAIDSVMEDGYYLNGFRGSKRDYEYAERIRRYHDRRYTITIADPGYNDIFFLDDDYWNVYIDGMYATITPTWNNPYWWNFQYSPFNYGSWCWRANTWGLPHYGWGGGYYGWNNSWNSWYNNGWYNPWYGYNWGYPYYGGYYGWGYYGWDYPYYGGGYYGWDNPYFYGGHSYVNRSNRRSYSTGDRMVNDSRSSTRRLSSLNAVSTRNPNSSVSRQRNSSIYGGESRRSTTTADRGTRTAYAPDVNTRMRTGSVRSSSDWDNVRSGRTYTDAGSDRSYNSDRSASPTRSTVINRSNPTSTTRSTSESRTYDSGSSRRSYDSGNSRSYDSGSRSSSSSSSRSYDNGSRSSSSSSSRSYDNGSRSSSSSSSSSRSSYSDGGSRSSSSSSGSSRSSGGGGGRR